jgi:hypothetical protein
MIVLDWDDTLLPTTQLTDNYGEYITGGAELPAHVVADLEVLQDTVCRFIAEANAIGHVSVITNAMNGPPARPPRIRRPLPCVPRFVPSACTVKVLN